MRHEKTRNSIFPCDMESPYAFISYNTNDKALVYEDVQKLQKRGLHPPRIRANEAIASLN